MVDDVATQVLNSAGHGSREPVDGWLGTAHLEERLRIHLGDRYHFKVPESVDQSGWSLEGPLHGYLLVKQHPDEQGQRIVV